MNRKEIYRQQAAEAARIVDGWPDSIKKNIIPPPGGRMSNPGGPSKPYPPKKG